MEQSSFYVVGHPLGHSMSPFIHNRLFALRGRNAVYAAKEILPEQLAAELPLLLKQASGINVTIPYKQAVIPALDGLEGRAALYRSVNTIRIGSDGCFGYNTDADGFLCALRGGGIPLTGHVALLGCGGVGRTFACEAALAGCSIVNAVRESSLKRAGDLRDFVQKLVPGTSYEIVTPDRLTGDFDLLINSTPVGMYPDCSGMPVPEDVLAHAAAVFDAVYNPRDTVLLKRARANGARTVGGLPMLVWQAAAAQTIWDDAEFDPAAIVRLTDDTAREMERRFV